MKTENEGRVLGIEVEKVVSNLEKVGAKYKFSAFQKRYVYDFHPAVKGRWIRLRSNGTKTTLTIKEINDNSVSGTRELEIGVSDFEKTNEFLQQLGYEPRSYQENFRIEFHGEGYVADIDYWPGLGEYLEIEAKTDSSVYQIFSLLGFDHKLVTGENVDLLYEKMGIDLDRINRLQFSEEELRRINDIRKGLHISASDK